MTQESEIYQDWLSTGKSYRELCEKYGIPEHKIMKIINKFLAEQMAGVKN